MNLRLATCCLGYNYTYILVYTCIYLASYVATRQLQYYSYTSKHDKTLLFHFVIGYVHKVYSWENNWSVMSSSKAQQIQVISCDIHHAGHVIQITHSI